jgi:hypothetical protein
MVTNIKISICIRMGHRKFQLLPSQRPPVSRFTWKRRRNLRTSTAVGMNNWKAWLEKHKNLGVDGFFYVQKQTKLRRPNGCRSDFNKWCFSHNRFTRMFCVLSCSWIRNLWFFSVGRGEGELAENGRYRMFTWLAVSGLSKDNWRIFKDT